MRKCPCTKRPSPYLPIAQKFRPTTFATASVLGIYRIVGIEELDAIFVRKLGKPCQYHILVKVVVYTVASLNYAIVSEVSNVVTAKYLANLTVYFLLLL